MQGTQTDMSEEDGWMFAVVKESLWWKESSVDGPFPTRNVALLALKERLQESKMWPHPRLGYLLRPCKPADDGANCECGSGHVLVNLRNGYNDRYRPNDTDQFPPGTFAGWTIAKVAEYCGQHEYVPDPRLAMRSTLLETEEKAEQAKRSRKKSQRKKMSFQSVATSAGPPHAGHTRRVP